MQKSDSIKELSTALSLAQGKFPTVKKDANNPFFKSRYADLASLIEAVQKPLTDNGLAILQLVSTNTEAKTVSVKTILTHNSGEYLCGEFSMPVLDWKPQGLGSTVTYCRRYSLQSFLNLAADDDDGEAGMARSNSGANEFSPKPKSAKAFNDSVAPKSPAVNSSQLPADPPSPKAEAETVSPQPSPFLDTRQIGVFWGDVKKVGGTEAILRKVLKEQFGIESTKQVKIGQVGEILEAVREAVTPESHGQPLGEF